MIHYDPGVLQIFSTAMIPAAFFMRLWRHSVSTFIFVLVAGGCSACAFAKNYDESIAGIVISAVELYLVIRAVMKTPQDVWFPKLRHEEGCDD